MSDAEAQLRERAESDGVRFFFAMLSQPCGVMRSRRSSAPFEVVM